MRSPVSHRIWIIVFWYLQLQCFHTNTAFGGTPVDEETEKIQTDVRLENLYHRILDNNEFTEMFHSAHIDGSHERPEAVEPAGQQWLPGANDGPTLSRAINHRHQINVAYSNLDDTFIPNEAATSSGHQEPMPRRTQTDQISVKYAFTNERHRRSVENLEVAASTASDVPSTEGLVPLEDDASITSSVANGDNVSSRGTIFSEAHLDPKAKHAIDFSNTVANSSPSRRSEEGRTGSTSELQIGDAVLAVINNVKVSNSVQPISNGASAEHSTTELTELKGHDEGDPNMLDTREGKVLDKASEQRSLSPEHPPSRRVKEDVAKEGAITPTHSSATSDGVRGASFILLDDSVYIAHDTQDHRRNGSSAGAHLPPAGTDLTLDSRIFAGRNFDEQIIFLNGPDLLETSVEQESSSSPTPELHGAPRRQMGKVARDVSRLYEEDVEEPLALPLRPIVRDPADAELAGEDNVVVLYADQREPVRLNCEVDADITTSVWLKDGQIVHAMDKKSRTADVRFVRESFGGLTIQSVMLEDDGVWQCEAENARGFFFNGRPIKLIVLDPPKEPYLLIDSRRLDAGNMFIPVKENAELTLACVSEGGNPKPTLSWEVLLSPGIDRHAQKLPNDVLELQELKKDKDKEPYRINSGAVSEAKLPGVFRVHHNARILCIMEHPTLKVRQNASILLDVQYTPSFAITRTPGFGYPLREGIEVSLKCDVDSNPPSTPLWQKDDGDTPVPQIGDGFLNFSSIRREHSGWYKCTSRHLNFQYSSIGYYLSVRYEPVDVTSEPVEQDLSMSSSSSSSSASSSSTFSASSASSSSVSNGVGSVKNSPPFGPFPVGSPIGSFKPGGQMEVELGGSVTLQCPQGSLGCWSHLDSAAVRLKGSGQTGQISLKDVVYQDAGTYKCVGQSSGSNRKRLDQPQTPVLPEAKVSPTVSARNSTPSVSPGTPLHLSVEFCANPPAYAARWLHGDRVYTPGNQYGSDVVAYGFTDLPTPFCKEARLTYVHMHENVPRRFYFVVSSSAGVAEAIFRVNLTLPRKPNVGSSPVSPAPPVGSGKRGNSFSPPSSSSSSSGAANVNGGLAGYKLNTVHSVPGNGLSDTGEELLEPEEIHFPIFGTGGGGGTARLGLPVAVASLASHWRRLLHALPLLLSLLLPPLLTL